MKKPTTLFIAMMLPCALHAQDTFTQFLYWLRYQNQWLLTEKSYWVNEADNRRFIEPDVQHQFIIHSRLHHRTGKWDIASGLTYSLGFTQVPENGYQRALEEIRPVLEVSHEQPVGKSFLQSRVRTDFRFLQTNAEESVFDVSRFVFRYRYRLQARIPLKYNDDKITTVWLKLADEIMFNASGNTFDQNRIYATGEFYLSRNFSLELGYLYMYQQRFNTEVFFNRHVLRFSVLHRVFHKTQKTNPRPRLSSDEE